MKIGHARYCLTPINQEIYLIGYRSPKRFESALGVHDDIYCNSLLFNDGENEVFIFSADFLEFEEDMVEDVKSMMQETFQIDRDHVLLSATHNHSSTVSYHKSWFTNKFNQAYYDYLLEIIKKSYQDCKHNLQEATVKYGTKLIKGYYGNRIHEGKLADNEVSVVTFYDQNETPFAGMINWAVHSTVLSANNMYLTAELAGNVSKKLYDSFGFYPMMMVGAAGDCSNRYYRQGNDFNELERVSVGLAREIANIQLDKVVTLSKIKSQVFYHTIHHDMKMVHEDIFNEIAKTEIMIANEKNQSQKEFLKNKIQNISLKLNQDSFHLDVKCMVITLGDIQLFIFPGELGSRFGIELKKLSDQLGVICGYTNGYYEYFMPEEDYGLSFETIGSYYPKKEPEKIIEKFKSTLKLLINDQKHKEG